MAYHPQIDGQLEVVNQGLETYLWCFAMGTPKQWSKWIPWVEFSYNTLFHTALRLIPFEVLYGCPPPQILRYEQGFSAVSEVDTLLCEHDAMLSTLKAELNRAQQRMTKAGNEKQCEVEYAVGDWVYLKLKPY